MTLKELAALAGVSAATASKALRGLPGVSGQMRQKIILLAQENGYVRTFTKKSACTRNAYSPKIGLIYSDMPSPVYSSLVARYSEIIQTQGGILLACDAHFSIQQAFAQIRYLDEVCMVDGIISIFSYFSADYLPKTRAKLIVNVGSIPSDKQNGYRQLPCDVIVSDGRSGVYQALACMKRLGHRKIACFSEPLTQSFEAHFLQMAAELALPADGLHVLRSSLRFEEAGYELGKRLISSGSLPTAILCAYDNIALGAAMALQEAGIRVPEDISLAGVGNSLLRLGNRRILGSIDTFTRQQPDIVVPVLLDRIRKTEAAPIQKVDLQQTFFPHETVGRCPSR